MKSVVRDLDFYARKARRRMRMRMTEKVSTRIDEETRKMLEKICDEAHLTMSEILRALIYSLVEYWEIEKRWGA